MARPKFGEARGWYERNPKSGMGANPKRPKSVKPYVAPVPSSVQATTGRTTPTKTELKKAAQSPTRARRKLAKSLLTQQKRKPAAKPPKAYKPDEYKATLKALSPTPQKVKAPKPEQPKKGVVRSIEPATAIISSVPGKGPKITRQRKQAARKELRQAKQAVRKTRKPAPLPGLDPEQAKVARTVLKTGKRAGATKKELLAAAETGLVESDFRNLNYGDADSQGWRQERGMYYDNPTNVKASAKRFFEESVSDTGGSRGKGQTAGELAQTIQASAFPEKYDERKSEAAAIVRAFQQGQADPKAVKRLRAAQGKAEKLGMKVAQPKGALGPPPKKVVTRYKAIDKAARALEKAGVPYVYGGGHEVGTPKNPKAGLDCSSSTVWVLNKAGVKIPNIVSGEFGNYLPSGPGAVTVFYNEGHVFMRIGDRYWGTSRSNPNSGPGFIEGGYDQAYLSQYNVAHVPGLGKKQALQLGIKPGDFMSAPGITFSNGGATATVNSATTQQKPGFSDKPIKLTPLQKVNRTKRELKSLGVGISSSSASTQVLDELAKKYGVAV